MNLNQKQLRHKAARFNVFLSGREEKEINFPGSNVKKRKSTSPGKTPTRRKSTSPAKSTRWVSRPSALARALASANKRYTLACKEREGLRLKLEGLRLKLEMIQQKLEELAAHEL